MTGILAADFKSALCRKEEPAFQLWLKLGRLVSYLFANPAIAIILVMVIASLLWWLSSRYIAKKTQYALGVGFLAAVLFCVSPAPIVVSNWLLVSFLPPDSGENAAAIVVLGRGPEENGVRATEAAKLWRARRAPLILSSGRVDAPMVAGFLKNQENISEAVTVQERCSLSTAENAEFTAAMMMPRGLSKIILLTDPLHMMRSLLTFKSFGFEVVPHLTPLVKEQSRFFAIRESLGAVSYGIMGRYFSKEVSVETIAEADKLVKQQQERGAATAIENY